MPNRWFLRTTVLRYLYNEGKKQRRSVDFHDDLLDESLRSIRSHSSTYVWVVGAGVCKKFRKQINEKIELCALLRLSPLTRTHIL